VSRPASDSRTYPYYVLGLLTLINLFNYADRNVVFAVFEPLKRDLQLSDQQLGWIGSAYIIVLSLAALPLGVLGDLRTRRGVIAWGVGLWSLFTSLGGAVRSFWQLFLCRAMVGVGEAGYGPVSQALIAEYFKEKRRALAIGVYSVGMALGGVLGIWLGGLLAEAYGWRLAFLWLGLPGFGLAILASRLREPKRRPPTPIAVTLRRFTTTGLRQAARYGAPVIGLSALGAVVSGILALVQVIPTEMVVAVFGMFVGVGVAWTVARLVPVALRRTSEAQEVAATAFEEFVEAAAIVLRVPTLIWVFVGGALVTFAVNGLIAWAASFMQRVHGFSVSDVGREFGLWGLAGGARRRPDGGPPRGPAVRALDRPARGGLRRRLSAGLAGLRGADPDERSPAVRAARVHDLFLLYLVQRSPRRRDLRRRAGCHPGFGDGGVPAVLAPGRRRDRAAVDRVSVRPPAGGMAPVGR
jgi:MFS family permease